MNLKAHGKLLIFGEYFVLDGCPALAFPTQLGQRLQTSSDDVQVKGLYWKSFNHKDELWFEAYFDEELRLLHGLNDEVAERLEKILQAARTLNPEFLRDGKYHEAHSFLEYPAEWGLGSSSTLISLVAQYANVDPMKLFFNSFPGSGYDVACAQEDGPILYEVRGQLAEWSKPTLQWDFMDQLHFVYLGKKQDSRAGIERYRNHGTRLNSSRQALSEIVLETTQPIEKERFLELMRLSEELIGEALGLTPVQESFPDFPGAIKSLGAWGGDFILAVPEDSSFDSRAYFLEKGHEIQFQAKELLLY